MRRKFVSLFAALLLGIGGLALVPSPAQAGAADCDPYNDNDIFCVYYNLLSTGAVQRFFPIPPRNTCIDARDPLGSDYGSYTNETYYRWFMFNTLTCGGSHWEVPPFSSGPNPGGWHVAIMRTSLRS